APDATRGRLWSICKQEPLCVFDGDGIRFGPGHDSWARCRAGEGSYLLCLSIANLDGAGAVEFARWTCRDVCPVDCGGSTVSVCFPPSSEIRTLKNRTVVTDSIGSTSGSDCGTSLARSLAGGTAIKRLTAA